ncbi:RNA recognition motif domain-containing protein [Streptomyces sp. NRAIS4]
MRTVQVGNLSRDTTEETLRTIFGDYGLVSRVTITRDGDKSFGSVTYTSAGEAEDAKRALDGAEFNGRQISVT